jgi:hypothetical protein
MALTVVHINRQATELEANARALWEKVLKPKWDDKARAEADKLFSKIKPGEILVNMTKPGA